MKKLSLILTPFLLITSFFLISCKNDGEIGDKKYVFKNLFEVPISTVTHDTLLSIYHSRAKYTKDYYLVTNTQFSPTQSISGPGLLLIDTDTNFYIANAFENIKVFNKTGKFIYKFEYPDRYNVSHYFIDENDNAFIFLIPLDQNEKKILVYKINLNERSESLLSDAETNQLQSSVFNPKNALEHLQRKKREQGTGNFYFDVTWGIGMKSLFSNDDGRFITLNPLNVYKFDTSYNININYIPNEYLYDSLYITNYCNDKVISISSVKVDKNGNIFISGVRSNEVERIKFDYGGEEVDAIKVYRPKFFLFELERRQ